MGPKSRQRLHDVLAVKLGVMLAVGLIYGVARLAMDGTWWPLFEVLAAGTFAAVMWLRTAARDEMWREGYRQAAADAKGTGGGLRTMRRVD